MRVSPYSTDVRRGIASLRKGDLVRARCGLRRIAEARGADMNRLANLATGVALALTCTAPALAQDYGRSPAFGTINLNANFPNDPRWLNVRAGGTRPASSVSACEGTIADAPDVRVNYNAAPGFALTFFVRSNADTILVINDPSGAWYCDDDSGEGLNPSIVFATPRSGQYDIWVGTLEDASLHRATLFVSETSSR